MELSEYTGALRGELAAITRFASEDVSRAGQMLSEAAGGAAPATRATTKPAPPRRQPPGGPPPGNRLNPPSSDLRRSNAMTPWECPALGPISLDAKSPAGSITVNAEPVTTATVSLT